nr:SGNH/GDSL hydrolase family protein [uncultured Niameybacter sp.]
MKKFLKTVLTSVLISSFTLTSVGFTSAQEVNTKGISKIVAFGDSASDNGGINTNGKSGAYNVSKDILALPEVPAGTYLKPGEVYWEQRYSNGKTAVEVLAEMMDKPLVNYATGGGTSGYGNYSDWMDTIAYSGVLGQIDKYAESLKGQKIDPTVLHFVMAGANDYFKFLDYGLEGTIEGVADQVVVNIETAIRELTALGAKKFFVPNCMPIKYAPFEMTMGRTEVADTFTKRVNAQLPAMLEGLEKELNIDITAFNVEESMSNIITNPQAYGITNIVDPCQPTYPEILPAKSNVDEYFFFDEWHFTRVAHRFLGEAMYSVAKTIK